MKLQDVFFLPKNKKHYFLTVMLLFGLLLSLTFLLPQMRQFVCSLIERFVLNRKIQELEWKHILFECALVSSVLMLILGFLFLTQPGRKLINKMEPESEMKNENFNLGVLENIISSKVFFAGFALFSGIIAFFRAANTGITYDEAFTYLYYVLPDVIDSFTKNQLLNNHLLNSLCIRMIMFFSQSKYNELLIRSPNLFFYCIYIVFSYLIARQHKNKFFVFILFISNYYLNEFFGLARGYGMACACMTGVCYYFEKWKSVYINKKNDSILFLLCLFFCSLGALANSITLYINLCFLILVNFKYKKYVFALPNLVCFLIFLLTALHSVIFSGNGFPIYSIHNIYYTIMSIPNMFTDIIYLDFLIILLFLLSFALIMIKTKAKDDYCWVLIIFLLICVVSQMIFRRGYPLMREMVPFYPVFVVVIANALRYISGYRIAKPIFAVCALSLLFQFTSKINIWSTKDWNDNYLIRGVVYSYVGSHDVINNKDEYLSFIKTNQEQSHGNPVYTFYAEKAEYLLKNNTLEDL